MTTVEGEVVASDDTDAPTLADHATRLGSVLAFEAAFNTYKAKVRGDLYAALLKARAMTGGVMKSVEVKYDDKHGVGFSLKGSSEKFTVEDEDALLAWVEEHFPTEVETVVQVRPTFRKLLLEKMLDGVDGQGFVKESTAAKDAKVVGEQVPGIKHIPASDDPTGFNTSWKGGADAAREVALAAVTGAAVGELLGGAG